MNNESPRRPPHWARRTTLVLAALLLAGCAARDAAPVRSDTPTARAPGDPVCPVAGARKPTPIDALMAYHGAVRKLAGSEQLRASTLNAPGEGVFMRMCQAIVLSVPGAGADLQRAWTLLRAVLAAEDGDAVAVRPLARMLAEDVQERLRLARVIERLDARLLANERARATLQKKLDALTEIERNLPARPSPDSTLPPPPGDAAPRRKAQ